MYIPLLINSPIRGRSIPHLSVSTGETQVALRNVISGSEAAISRLEEPTADQAEPWQFKKRNDCFRSDIFILMTLLSGDGGRGGDGKALQKAREERTKQAAMSKSLKVDMTY